MEEDGREEQQEVFESTLKNPTLNTKAFLPMSEDVDMTEAQAPVTKELILNITEHKENNNVSLFYCYILKFILTDLNIKEPWHTTKWSKFPYNLLQNFKRQS